MHPDLASMITVGPLILKQGENSLVVDIHPDPGSRPSWFYAGIVSELSGKPGIG